MQELELFLMTDRQRQTDRRGGLIPLQSLERQTGQRPQTVHSF